MDRQTDINPSQNLRRSYLWFRMTEVYTAFSYDETIRPCSQEGFGCCGIILTSEGLEEYMRGT